MVGKRVVGYVRVSTEKQADQGISLEAQRQKITAYAQLYDLELIGIVEDAGYSAKNLKRPGLQQVLRMLKRKEVDGVVIVKLDRLTRRLKDLCTLLEEYFTRYALMSVSDQLDTQTANGRMFVNLLGTISQWEREIIGERTKEALHYKQHNGEKLGGECPYGYTAVDGRLVEDLDEQAMLTLIRHYRAVGLSLRAITAELTRQGYTTRKGTPMCLTQVARMVKHLKETA